MAPAPPEIPPAATPQNGITVSLMDRWLLLGATGTCKTRFAKELIKRLLKLWPDTPLYILESKDAGDFEEWYGDGLYLGDEPPPLIRKGAQVWRPGADRQQAYDIWFDRLLHAEGPLILLNDEISSITRGSTATEPFQRLMKQGRGLGKCAINCSQEFHGSPKQIKTQTTHVCRWRMEGEQDVWSSNRFIRRAHDAPEPPHKYGFFYTRKDEMTPTRYYPRYQTFF